MMLLDLAATLAPTPTPSLEPGQERDWLTQPVATIGAGIIVGFGALLGFIASLLNRSAMNRNTDLTHSREVSSARQNRFTVIAEQLSNEHSTVRIAGIYGLSALADEWNAAGETGLRDVAIELLCAYLRDNSRPDDKRAREAAIAEIRAHTLKDSNPMWPGSSINLTDAALPNANLIGSNLSGANLNGTVLDWANMDSAVIAGTELTDTWFTSTNLTDADMSGSIFSGCHFNGAVLIDTNMSKAEFPVWIDMNSEGIKITPSDLHGAKLYSTNLSGAYLRTAEFGLESGKTETMFVATSSEEINGEYVRVPHPCIYDEETAWPPGFDIAATINRQLHGD